MNFNFLNEHRSGISIVVATALLLTGLWACEPTAKVAGVKMTEAEIVRELEVATAVSEAEVNKIAAEAEAKIGIIQATTQADAAVREKAIASIQAKREAWRTALSHVTAMVTASVPVDFGPITTAAGVLAGGAFGLSFGAKRGKKSASPAPPVLKPTPILAKRKPRTGSRGTATPDG